MKNSITIYFLPLIVGTGIYYFFLRKKESAIMNLIKSVPATKEKYDEFLKKDLPIECAKILACYLVSLYAIKKM
jgi:hypothetical protein